MNFKDILSHLSYRQACKLLGPPGEELIRAGGTYEIDIGEQVVWGSDFFKLNLGGPLSPSLWNQGNQADSISPVVRAGRRVNIRGRRFP